MKIPGYVLIAVLVLLLAIAAGCTTPQQTPAATQSPQAATAAAQQTYSAPAATRAASSADIDTMVNVHGGELACINVQELLGSDYLYPDQQFKLEAAPPASNAINVNILFVDENNQLKLREVEPVWDGVHKTWVYDGVVPAVKFIAITTPVEKTFTIKTQSKYYICADDRKEAGTGDVIYRVPVKLTKL
jgi:hypothetical protein